MSKAQHIVIDTNVLISAGLLPNSKTATLLAAALERYVLAQNEATWGELQTRISRQKFDRYFGDRGRFTHLTRLAQSAEFFKMVATADACRDPSDNKFLALAIDAGASAIVTGDEDLQTLHPHQGVAIYSPSDFSASLSGRIEKLRSIRRRRSMLEPDGRPPVGVEVQPVR